MGNLMNRINEITKVENGDICPPFPQKNLLIEITNICNSNCIFCANSKMKRKRKYIKKELVINVLKQAYQLGTREVGFYTTGEPLLDKNLNEYIAMAKDIGYNYVYITTNGILLDKSKAQELINSEIDSIKLSINGINNKDYKFIHGTDKYDTVMNNLRDLYNLRKRTKSSFKIYVSYISTRYTDYDINIIKNNFKKYCDEVVIVNVRNQAGMMPEINKTLSCINTNNKVQADRVVPCHYVFDTINVTCEGFLTACCTDFENYLVYADLNKTTLKEAWHNEIITSLRKKHLENKLGNTLCNNCINCSYSIPSPLCREYIETEIGEETFNSNSVEKRIQKKLKM